MFERFTERARQVVLLTQEEARTLGHDYIGTEHILLGLLREEEGLAAQTLEAFDVDVERVREKILAPPSDPPPGSDPIPFTPRAKKVLERSLREALSLGHNYIGTEHILLGLLREHLGVGYRILLEVSGVDSERIRSEVICTAAGSRRIRPGTTSTRKGTQPMIGWNSTLSRDYDEAVANGRVDQDLDRMRDRIGERIKERDGVPRCPECGLLLEDVHEHDGFRVVRVAKSPGETAW